MKINPKILLIFYFSTIQYSWKGLLIFKDHWDQSRIGFQPYPKTPDLTNLKNWTRLKSKEYLKLINIQTKKPLKSNLKTFTINQNQMDFELRMKTVGI